MGTKTMNIGILTTECLSDFGYKILLPILNDDSFSVKLAVIDKRPGKTVVQKIKKNIRRGRGGYIFIMAIKKIIASKKQKTINIKNICIENKINVIETKEPYSNITLNTIKEYNLDVLLLLSGFGIIKEPLLSIATMGVLSYHHGNMRKYRGMPPAFWELYNDEKEVGVTVQILSAGLDCGLPIEERSIKIYKKDSLSSLRSRLYEESADMMYKALLKLYRQDYVSGKIDEYGKVYTLPNFRQWIYLYIKTTGRKLKR